MSRCGPPAAVHYYFSDHLGSSNVVTNATGATIEEESDFYPFGGERVITDLLPDQRYKFTGKERDPESNLDYFGARYYSSNLGRFLTPDWASTPTAVPYADFGNPQSLNLYGYVKNNPLNATDLDGHGEIWEAIKASHVFFAKEVRGALNATVVPAAKLQIAIMNGQAQQNIAETVKIAATKPGGLVEAGKEAVSQVGSTLKAAAQGNPDAIGGVVATAATLAAPFAKSGPVTETVTVGGAPGAIKAGIYEGPDATAPGLTRVGQSGEMARRLPEQEAAGRFPEGTQVRVTEIPGGKTAREIAEHNRIQQLGGVRSVPGSQTSNIRNPIGKARQDLLKP